MNRNFRSTTALVLSLSLAAGPGWTQSEDAAECDPAAPAFPCTIDGVLIESDPSTVADPVEEVAPAEEAVEEAPAEEAVEEAPAEEVVEEAPADEVMEEAPAEEVVEEAPADEAVEEAPAEEAVEEAPADEAVEEAPAEEAVEEAPADEAVEEAPTEEVMEEAPAEEVMEEAPAEEAVEDAPAEEVMEEAPAEEAMEEAPAEEAVEEAPAEEAVEEAPAADEAMEETPAEETDPATEMAEEVAPTPEETVEEAPVTAAASAEGEGEGEVTTEEVVEGDVRTADEDFTTAVTGDAATANNDDGGLSNFEKAILIGLGAVAIGSILDNGDEVVSNSGDRIVLQNPDGEFRVLKNDDVLLRQPGSQVQTEQFSDGSTRAIVTRQDGTQVITIRATDGRVLRRALVQLDGTQVELFDDTQVEQAVDVSTLPTRPVIVQRATATATQDELRAALDAELGVDPGRTFSLRQVRDIREVRDLAPVVDLDSITFQSGSAAIQPDQARELALLGTAINDVIVRRPGAVFLIEGHTDAVGNAGYNLALSDRRAETVALALTEYFDVPAVNLITQGYGESNLKVRTLEAEQANRRAVVRNITRLLR